MLENIDQTVTEQLASQGVPTPAAAGAAAPPLVTPSETELLSLRDELAQLKAERATERLEHEERERTLRLERAKAIAHTSFHL
jgi:hypothetical protein